MLFGITRFATLMLLVIYKLLFYPTLMLLYVSISLYFKCLGLFLNHVHKNILKI